MDFTQETILKMKELYEENTDSTYTSIAKVFGANRKIIAKILKKNGVKPKEQIKKIKIEKTIQKESPKISLESKEIDSESKHNRIINFIGKKIPDASEQFIKKARKSEIHFVAMPKGIMTDNCVLDPLFDSIYFFKSYHDIISWFREYIKKAIKGGYEDELKVLEIYMNGKRIHPEYKLHVSINLDENVKEEIIFEHNKISVM